MHTRHRSEVDRVDARALDEASFLRTYLLPNRPVLLTGLTTRWRACADWVAPGGAPDVAALAARFGASRVAVADCAAAEDAPRLSMTLCDYAAYWREHAAGRDARTLYLKDWHLAAEHPGYQAYAPPPLFGSDALNGYYDARCSRIAAQSSGGDAASAAVECADYRFVYLGPAGSATPLHADVLHSASWSANVAGVKHWLLFPPAQTALLTDARGGLPVDAAAERATPSGAFPRIAHATPLALTQRPGEALFVPCGWHHQVRNVTHALSINHNWCHPAALHWLCAFVRADAGAAAAAISDLAPPALPEAEFAALCQRNTAANAGMDFAQLASCAWLAAQAPLQALAAGSGGGVAERAAHALALQRCGAVLRSLAAEPAHCFVHHAEDGEARVAPTAWADAAAAALAAAGFTPCF
jgi:hypothetical protein